MPAKKQHLHTRIIRTRAPQSGEREQITPLYMNSGFNFENAAQARDVYAGEEPGYVYGRWANPQHRRICRPHVPRWKKQKQA